MKIYKGHPAFVNRLPSLNYSIARILGIADEISMHSYPLFQVCTPRVLLVLSMVIQHLQ